MYNNALQRCENFLPSPVGGLTKRVGSRYLAELPFGVDGLSPIILPYYVYVGRDTLTYLIVIAPQPKAKPEDNFHEPVITFFAMDSGDWIKKDNEPFEIRFTAAGSIYEPFYVFPLCPSFEQFQQCRTIQNGSSIILFSQYYPLVISPTVGDSPFRIRLQEFVVPPYSFGTGSFLVTPREILQYTEHETPLSIHSRSVIPQDIKIADGVQTTPLICLSGVASNVLDTGLYVSNHLLEGATEAGFDPKTSQFRVYHMSFGNSGQRFMVVYKDSNPAEPDLQWNGIIRDVKITRGQGLNSSFATLVTTWIYDECPKAASGTPPSIMSLPGNSPEPSGPGADLPAMGPQATATWYISAIGLDSSSLGGVLFNETSEDKQVWIHNLNDPLTNWSQTRNPLEGYDGLIRGGGGFPKDVCLFEGRLFLANIGADVNGIWGSSRSHGDWFDFKPGINPGDGIRERISSMETSYINWLVGGTRLFVGTADGVYICGSVNSNNDDALTSGNFSAKLISAVSVSPLRPLLAGDSVLFLGANGIALYEIILDPAGIYRTNNISLLSDDVLTPGVISHTWLEYPDKCYWAALGDGGLRSMSYMKSNSILAWAEHSLGANSHGAFVKFLDAIHSGDTDELIMAVERAVDGRSVLYLESIQNSPEKRKEISELKADCAKDFSITYDIYAVKKSQFFSITLDSDFTGKNQETLLFFWTGAAEDTIFEKNIGFSFFIDGADNTKVHVGVEDTVTDEGWNPSDNYGETVHLFGWRPGAYSLQDGFITITDAAIVAEFKDKYLIFPGFSSKYGSDNDADYLKNRDAVFYLRDDGQVGDRDGPHAPVQFRLEAGAPTLISPFFEIATLDTGVEESFTPAVNGRLALNTTADDLKRALQGQDDNAVPNGFFRILNLSRFPKINNSSYVVLKTDNQFQVEPYGEDPTKCQLRLCLVEDIHYPQSPKLFPNLSDEPEQTFVSSGDAFLYMQFLKGLDHLNGESVQINVNGNDLGGEHRVSPQDDWIGIWLGAGEVGNLHFAYVAYVGYAYKSVAFSVPAYVPSPVVGSSLGLVSHQKGLILRVYNSVGGKYGSTEGDLYPVEYRRIGPVTNEPLAPYSGTLTLPMPNFSLDSNTFYLQHDTAEPFSVLSVTQDIYVADDAI
jgi:hypothetical protein